MVMNTYKRTIYNVFLIFLLYSSILPYIRIKIYHELILILITNYIKYKPKIKHKKDLIQTIKDNEGY